MLLAMSRLYHCDRLNQELVLEYWNPSDDLRLNIMPFRNTPRKVSQALCDCASSLAFDESGKLEGGNLL